MRGVVEEKRAARRRHADAAGVFSRCALALIASMSLGLGCGRLSFEQRDAEPSSADAGSPPDAGSGRDGGAADAGSFTDAGTALPELRCDWASGPRFVGGPALMAINSDRREQDGFFWTDELTFYFSVNTPTGGDLFVASRAAPDAPLGGVTAFAELNTDDNDTGFILSADGTLGFFSTDRPGGAGMFDIWIARRDGATGPFAVIEPLDDVNTAGHDFDPRFTRLGNLWFSPNEPIGGLGSQDLAISHQNPDGTFTAPELVAELNSAGFDADPAPSGDETVVLFASNRAGGTGGSDLYYAVRADPSAEWGAPVELSDINTVADEAEPFLSEDGCELIFTSDRPGGVGDRDFYRIELMP